MASSSSYLLVLAIVVAFLSISCIAARPCKTFLISSRSLSITPENPNLNSNSDSDFSSTRSVTFFTIIQLSPNHIAPYIVNRRHGFLPSTIEKSQIHENRPQLSFPFISENLNSFGDRTKDILSVVVALLFGVGCGALTAATMYLVWALVVNRNSFNFDEDDYENDESDAASLKKLGYVKIPDPIPSPAPAPLKETA